MQKALFGIETEYAYHARLRSGHLDNGTYFMEVAKKMLPHLECWEKGICLENGARLYVDCGGHPEYATPECTDPWDAVRHVVAGDRLMAGILQQMRENGLVEDVWMSRCNVDYSGNGSTWGCHTSYLTRSEPRYFGDRLRPFLISRVIFSGAGGWFPGASPPAFVLSARSFFLVRDVTSDTQGAHGIFHLRNERHAGGCYHRLHILPGESLMSQYAIFLTVATTALVVAFLDENPFADCFTELPDTIRDLRVYAGDPACSFPCRKGKGKPMTALDVQYRYLEQCESVADQSHMPPWSRTVCWHWRFILDAIGRNDVPTLASRLDWAMKKLMFDGLCESEDPSELLPGVIWPPSSPRVASLHEADMRFGQISERSIFESMDIAGMLRHRMVSEQSIRDAMTTPPSGSRAVVRGRMVRQYAGNRNMFGGWTGIIDQSGNRKYDLSDPLALSGSWRPWHAARGRERVMASEPVFYAEMNDTVTRYRQGWYAGSLEALERMTPRMSDMRPLTRERFYRYQAWLRARMGYDDAEHLLVTSPSRAAGATGIYDVLSAVRFTGLEPPAAIMRWIQRMKDFKGEEWPLFIQRDEAFVEHLAAYALSRGRDQQALRLLDESEKNTGQIHIILRRRVLSSEALRRLGREREARGMLDRASDWAQAHTQKGNVADYILMQHVRFQVDRAGAEPYLQEAEAIQRELRQDVGLLRTLLLRARFAGDMETAKLLHFQCVEILNRRPGLARCRFVKRIMSRWNHWVTADLKSIPPSRRFWLI